MKRNIWQRSKGRIFGVVILAMTSGHHAKADAIDASPLIMPVPNACLSSPFGARLLPHRPLAGSFHNGIDLAAPIGSPVVALAPGRLLRIQRRGVGGLEILIQHAGFVGVYSHLGQIAPAIAQGSRTIYGGERLAVIGRSGLTYGPHLFFGMIVEGRPVDPVPFLDVRPCRAQVAKPAPEERRSGSES